MPQEALTGTARPRPRSLPAFPACAAGVWRGEWGWLRRTLKSSALPPLPLHQVWESEAASRRDVARLFPALLDVAAIPQQQLRPTEGTDGLRYQAQPPALGR